MADYTFFYNPMSRAQMARFALHEVRADYSAVLVEWENKPAALLKANPLGKIPTIIHHAKDGDRVVCETAAICHYLADAEGSDLLPTDAEKADYFRWLFFAAGPLEAGVTANSMGWKPTEEQQMSAGFGSYERVADALDTWLSAHNFVCGARYTMADVYVGSHVMWGLQFKTLPDRRSFKAYADRVQQRPAYQEASAIDMREIEERRGRHGG